MTYSEVTSVPVPVFFLFDLKTILCMAGTQFSEQSLAGGGGILYQGEEAFSKLNFTQIYKKGYMENSEVEKSIDRQKLYYGDKAAIVFSKTAKKIQYTSKYKSNPTDQLLLNAEAEFEWMYSSNMLLRQGCRFQIDYEKSEHMTFTNLSKPNKATALYMKIYIEKKLVCYMCWQLADSALL